MTATTMEPTTRDYDMEFRDITGQRRVAVTAAPDKSISEVLPAVQARMKLAQTDSSGEPILYRVHTEDQAGSGRAVSPSERVADVCSGSTTTGPSQFVIHQEIVAG